MKPGIYRDMDSATYFADPAPEPSLSQSIAKTLLDRSPLHAWCEHPRLCRSTEAEDDAEKYVKAQAIGNAAHKLMLSRGKEIEVITGFNDFKKDDAKKLRDAANAAGRVPILEKHMAGAEQMVAAAWTQLKRHEDRDAFTDGSGEVCIVWEEDGIWCRSLIDWLSHDLRTVDDYKSSGMSMAPHILGYRAEAAGWHIQAAFIERGLDVLDPDRAGRRRFRFIGQENTNPFALNVMHMDEHWLTMGRKMVDTGIELWRRSITTGKWPSYPPRGITPEYPGFKETKWLDRETSGEFEISTAPKIASLMGG